MRVKAKAAILYEMGQPGPYAKTRPIAIEEVELDPRGPGEVLVEIKGAGLCHSDLSVINGSRPRALPLVPGGKVAEERTIKGSYMGSSAPVRDIPRFIELYR